MSRAPKAAKVIGEIHFVVPGIPPSVNMYVRHTRSGKHYRTAEATGFMQSIAIYAPRQKFNAKSYHVEITIWLGKGDKGDIDNFAKCVLDGLVRAEIIHSDSAVTRLLLTKERDPGAEAATAISVMAF